MAIVQDEHWIEAQKTRIKEAFTLFDKDKKGTIPCSRRTGSMPIVFLKN